MLLATRAAVLWKSAAAKCTAADDPHFRLFSIVCDPLPAAASAAASKGSSASGSGVPADRWSWLRIDAALPWPLGVLVTREHLARYNEVFSMLLQLKHVQLALESAWQEVGRWAAARAICSGRGVLGLPLWGTPATFLCLAPAP
jgi:gamma-tubulin complex component 4